MWTVLILVTLTLCSCEGYDYNYYVYAQQWPSFICGGSRANTLSKSGCEIPSNVTTWTVHGLWPSVNESFPNNCNASWPLNETDILPIEDQMRADWPSFAGGYLSFWDHEWSKHGTCAASEILLRGPYRYFKYSLMLNERFNILEQLSSKKIVPVDDHCYNYTTFANATRELFNESVILGCAWDPVAKQQHIAQIEICLDREFQLKCNPSKISRSKPRNYGGPYTVKMPHISPCRSNEQICYNTIHH